MCRIRAIGNLPTENNSDTNYNNQPPESVINCWLMAYTEPTGWSCADFLSLAFSLSLSLFWSSSERVHVKKDGDFPSSIRPENAYGRPFQVPPSSLMVLASHPAGIFYKPTNGIRARFDLVRGQQLICILLHTSYMVFVMRKIVELLLLV